MVRWCISSGRRWGRGVERLGPGMSIKRHPLCGPHRLPESRAAIKENGKGWEDRLFRWDESKDGRKVVVGGM